VVLCVLVRAQITRHEEFWNVSPVAALLMMFKPGPPIPGSSSK
jgi:hypothetical protein